MDEATSAKLYAQVEEGRHQDLRLGRQRRLILAGLTTDPRVSGTRVPARQRCGPGAASCQGSCLRAARRWRSPGRAQHGVEHRRRQPSGEGVLLADVVAAEQRSAAGRPDAQRSPRRRARTRGRGRGELPAGLGQRAQQRLPADTRRAPPPPAPWRQQLAVPGPDTARRCRAPSGVGLFAGGAQCTGAVIRTPVSTRPSSTAVDVGCDAQPGAVQRGEQHVAAAVAGEHPPGAVGAVRGRRQPDDQHPRIGRAEPRNRPAPVGLVRGTTAA